MTEHGHHVVICEVFVMMALVVVSDWLFSQLSESEDPARPWLSWRNLSLTTGETGASCIIISSNYNQFKLQIPNLSDGSEKTEFQKQILITMLHHWLDFTVHMNDEIIKHLPISPGLVSASNVALLGDRFERFLQALCC